MREVNELEVRGKIWFHSMHCVFEKFAQNNLPYALIKGEALSYHMYNQVGRRISNDIDLLVDKSDLDNIDRILTSCGFTQYIDSEQKLSRADIISCIMNSHQTVSYKKIIKPFNIIIDVDINFSLFWGEYKGTQINISEILQHTVDLDIYGENVKTLLIPYAFVQVILHHYKDCNSIFLLYTRKNYLRSLFEEIYQFWLNCAEKISLRWLIDYSKQNQITEYIFYMLYYTNVVYSDSSLGEYVDGLKTERGLQLLNCFGLDDTERKEWKVDFQERVNADSIKELIESQLTDKDKEKIKYNMHLY